MKINDFNEKFEMDFTQEQIKDLATDIYTELLERYGNKIFRSENRQRQIIKYTYEKIIGSQAMVDLIYDNAYDDESREEITERIMNDQMQKSLFAKGLASMVADVLLETRSIKVKEQKLFESIFETAKGLFLTGEEKAQIGNWYLFENVGWSIIQDRCKEKFGKDIAASRLEKIVMEYEDLINGWE